MNLKGHIATSLFALWQWPSEGRGVLKYLDASAKGTFRSFFSLLFIFPVFYLILWLQFMGPNFEWVTPFHILGLFAGYILATAGFAFLIFHAQGTVGPRQNFLYFMPLYNWGRIIALLLLVPFFALERYAFLEANTSLAIFAITVGSFLLFKVALTRTALGVNYFHGLVFVAFDILMILIFQALILQVYTAFI